MRVAPALSKCYCPNNMSLAFSCPKLIPKVWEITFQNIKSLWSVCLAPFDSGDKGGKLLSFCKISYQAQGARNIIPLPLNVGLELNTHRGEPHWPTVMEAPFCLPFTEQELLYTESDHWGDLVLHCIFWQQHLCNSADGVRSVTTVWLIWCESSMHDPQGGPPPISEHTE